jgi:hypothetical protein
MICLPAVRPHRPWGCSLPRRGTSVARDRNREGFCGTGRTQAGTGSYQPPELPQGSQAALETRLVDFPAALCRDTGSRQCRSTPVHNHLWCGLKPREADERTGRVWGGLPNPPLQVLSSRWRATWHTGTAAAAAAAA